MMYWSCRLCWVPCNLVSAFAPFLTRMALIEPTIAGLASVHGCIGAVDPVRTFGNTEQKQRFLPGLADGSRLSAVSASPDFEDRRVHITALEDQAMYNFTDATIDSGGTPIRLRGMIATPSLLHLLRAKVA